MSKSFLVYCDASITEGQGVGGFLIKDIDGVVLATGTKDLRHDNTMTNNIAEFEAVKAALVHMIEKGWVDDLVTVHSDSQLIIRQINDEYRCNSDRLRLIRDDVWRLLGSFNEDVLFKWIPREENTEADAVSRSLY